MHDFLLNLHYPKGVLALYMLRQVIAREDKGEEHGIDYKYSDMITSYGGSGSNIEPLEQSYTEAPTTQLPNLNQVHIS